MTDEIEDEQLDDDLLDAARQELNGFVGNPREFVYACEVSEIPATGRHGKVVRMEDVEVALFNIEGDIFAISNLCPHEMTPLLAAGFVDCYTRTVACPLHGWTFEIPTGKRMDAVGAIPIYPVKVEAGEVWIEI